MGIEELKKQLAEGTITKEKYTAELKALLDAGTITQEQHDEAAKSVGGEPGGGNQFTDEQLAQIQKMMQSEADKVRTKAALEKKALEDELEAIRTAKMSEEEKAKHELDKLRKQNEDTAAELLKEKVGFHTVKTLAAKGLPSEFGDFLAGGSIEETDARISALEGAWQTALKAAVDAKFKDGGVDPTKRGGAVAKKWNEMSVDEKGNLFKEDPTKARELAKAAGINL